MRLSNQREERPCDERSKTGIADEFEQRRSPGHCEQLRGASFDQEQSQKYERE